MMVLHFDEMSYFGVEYGTTDATAAQAAAELHLLQSKLQGSDLPGTLLLLRFLLLAGRTRQPWEEPCTRESVAKPT